jgi:hypothetical protein
MASTGFSYFLVYPRANRLPRKTQLFRDWILAEAGQLSTDAQDDNNMLTP